MKFHRKYCKSAEPHDRRVCRIKALNADPEFKAANRESMKRRHADPEFKAANRERMKRRHANPEFRARRTARLQRGHGGDPAGLSEYGRTEYDAARSEGFGLADAMDIARDAERMTAAEGVK